MMELANRDKYLRILNGKIISNKNPVYTSITVHIQPHSSINFPGSLLLIKSNLGMLGFQFLSHLIGREMCYA